MASWEEFFKFEKTQPYFQNLLMFLKKEIAQGKIIYPNKNDWFKCFKATPLEKVQVVFLGQDPYHTPGVADGLAFSTQKTQLPPSLKNIFQEIKNCYPDFSFKSGDLISWANQGVLLINRVLTVEKNSPTSHYNQGWETFTKHALEYLVAHKKDIVFVLLGTKAQSIEQEVDLSNNYVIKLPHPSPFSAHRGFLKSDLFIKINHLVKQKIHF